MQGAAADSLPGPDYECGMPPLRGGSAPCVSERRVGLVSSVTSRRWDRDQGHRTGPAVPGPSLRGRHVFPPPHDACWEAGERRRRCAAAPCGSPPSDAWWRHTGRALRPRLVECFDSHVALFEAVLAWRCATRYATSASCLRAHTLLRDAVTASRNEQQP